MRSRLAPAILLSLMSMYDIPEFRIARSSGYGPTKSHTGKKLPTHRFRPKARPNRKKK